MMSLLSMLYHLLIVMPWSTEGILKKPPFKRRLF